MAVEPQVFICYGRPDKGIADELAREFWRNRIECYNYLSKPIEDRLGDEIHQRGYIFAAELFIAILSADSVTRFSVAEEIAVAHQVATRLNDSFFRTYISLSAQSIPFPEPDLVIDWNKESNITEVVSVLLQSMPPSFIERNQKAWETNRTLYPDKWTELNERYVPKQSDA